jgi:hypothetical protein
MRGYPEIGLAESHAAAVKHTVITLALITHHETPNTPKLPIQPAQPVFP